MAKLVNPNDFEDVDPDEYEDVPTVDAGPTARRAAGGGSPSGPRDLTDEEAGTNTGPVETTYATTANDRRPVSTAVGAGPYREVQAPEPTALPSTDIVGVTRHPGTGFGFLGMQGPPKTIAAQRDMGEMRDPLVQMGTAYAMGRGAGGIVAEVPALAAAAPAVESGVANKAMGGDFTTGAMLGAGPLARAAGQAAADAALKGAPARVAARTVRNLTEEAPKRIADKVARAAGDEGDRLNAVIDRNPDLRRALAIQAKDQPARALTHVEHALTKRNATLDGAFETMENHYANLPASAQASVPQILDDIDGALARNKGDLDKTQAIRRARAAIVDEFGPDGTISPNQLRSLKHSVGRAAFPVGTVASESAKAQVARELYRPLSKQLNALAKNTPGLDAKAFMEANEDVSTLIPVREAIADRVAKLEQGKKNWRESAAAAAHKLSHVVGGGAGYAAHGPVGAAVGAALPTVANATLNGMSRVARGIDYRLAEAQLARQARRGLAPAPARAPAPAIAPAAAGVATGAANSNEAMSPVMVPAM